MTRIWRALALLAILGLGACAGGEGPTHNYPTGADCLRILDQRGIAYERLPERDGPGECGMDTPIRLLRTDAALNRPADMSCSTALAWSDFERNVMQPVALRTLGQPVIRIDHFGAYNCRPIAGSSRLSEHGRGLAFDIGGFQLLDGTVVSVLNDWYENTRPADFLHRIAREGCHVFNVVLGPGYNADHRNHLHLDLGRWRSCSP